MNVLSPLRVLSDSLWAGKLRLAQWEGAKAAVDRRETRRGLTAAKNSGDNFSLRTSVVQQPETFAKNSNYTVPFEYSVSELSDLSQPGNKRHSAKYWLKQCSGVECSEVAPGRE